MGAAKFPKSFYCPASTELCNDQFYEPKKEHVASMSKDVDSQSIRDEIEDLEERLKNAKARLNSGQGPDSSSLSLPPKPNTLRSDGKQ